MNEDHLRLAEALVFASAEPVSSRALQLLLPDDADADEVLSTLRERSADRGVVLVEVAGGWQFRTAEIEEIRGISLSQGTMDALLESGMIVSLGRREVPGRPTLWGTTPAFLAQFGLKDLRGLPRREDLMVEPAPLVPVAPAVETGED